jgi:hypothetical protein
MRTTSALTVAALTTIALTFSGPARAGERWLAVPEEAGPRQIGQTGWIPWRCADGPVQNLYHGARYDAPPAIYLGYAYRPFYRYTAWRVIPRTYFCADR